MTEATKWLEDCGPQLAAHRDESDQENELQQARLFNRIRDALSIDTTELTKQQGEELCRLVDALNSRVVCEAWGRKMGWTIPDYGTVEWQQLFTAWMESEEDA